MVTSTLTRYDVSIQQQKRGENEPACIMPGVTSAFAHTVGFFTGQEFNCKMEKKDFSKYNSPILISY